MGSFGASMGGLFKNSPTPGNYIGTNLSSSDKTMKALRQSNEQRPGRARGFSAKDVSTEHLRVINLLLKDPNAVTTQTALNRVRPVFDQIQAGTYKAKNATETAYLKSIQGQMAEHAKKQKASTPAPTKAPAPAKAAAPVAAKPPTPVAAETPAAAAATSVIGTKQAGTVSSDTGGGGGRSRRRGRVASLLGGLGGGGSETFGG